jgi:acetyl esterase/lipase
MERFRQPLQDAQRAMGYVRNKAAQFDIQPDRIGVLGFSAGGHLLAVLSNAAPERTYPPVDDCDKVSARPDFTLLVYPAYLSLEDKGETLAPEVQPRNTPPTFIVQAEDDKNFIAGTLLYYRALRDVHVPAELHVYARGGHGYGMRHTADPVTDWPRLAETWLAGQGIAIQR